MLSLSPDWDRLELSGKLFEKPAPNWECVLDSSGFLMKWKLSACRILFFGYKLETGIKVDVWFLGFLRKTEYLLSYNKITDYAEKCSFQLLD